MRKNWKRRLLAGLAAFAFALPAQAAGTLTVTATSVGSSGVTRYTLAWLSTAGGAVSGNTLDVRAGYIYQIQFVPDGGGTAPTDLYDIVLNDSHAVDFCIAGGANLSSTTSKLLQISPALYYDGFGALDLVVSNAGNAKGGTVYLGAALKRLAFALALFALSAEAQVTCVGGACAGSSDVTSPVTTDPLVFSGGTGISSTNGICAGGASAAANSVCLATNTITGEGATADAFETIFAFGDATGDQTITWTGAATSLGAVVAGPVVPTNLATVGNSLNFTASPAIPNAGAGTDGAAAGGGFTFTSGAAARDTSGNANGGDFTFTPGAGIGTGVAGRFITTALSTWPNGTTAAPSLSFVTNAGTGIYSDATFGPTITVAGAADGSFNNSGFDLGSAQPVLWHSTTSSIGGSRDTGLVRDAAALVRVSDGSTGIGAFAHRYSVETIATSKTTTAAESGELYTNGADVDGLTVTLMNDPTAGIFFTFSVVTTITSNSFSIAASAGETLKFGNTSCATSLTATAVGSTVTILAASGGSGGVWVTVGSSGTWTCT